MKFTARTVVLIGLTFSLRFMRHSSGCWGDTSRNVKIHIFTLRHEIKRAHMNSRYNHTRSLVVASLCSPASSLLTRPAPAAGHLGV